MEASYEVFLSYNSEDQEFVKRIEEELSALKLRVWFDEKLTYRQTLYSEIENAIEASASFVVFIGPSGIGEWQLQEVEAAMEEHRQRGCPVIPVVLPKVVRPDIPIFLKRFRRIDFRERSFQRGLDELIRGIVGERLRRSISQIGEMFSLTLKRPDRDDGRTIDIATLPNPKASEQLDVRWDTFGKGIDILKTQIKNYGQRVPVDACFGVNEAGLVMATFLAGGWFQRVKIGYIKCEGAGEKTTFSEDSYYPDLKKRPTILIADFEVKTSNILGLVVARLREKYRDPDFYFAVFGAMTRESDLKLKSFDDLVSASFLKKLNIKDYFIACTMADPGIEPPHGLR